MVAVAGGLQIDAAMLDTALRQPIDGGLNDIAGMQVHAEHVEEAT
jgi:hypothetical protein